MTLPHLAVEPGYAPNQEEFEFCRQFVITVVLRFTEISAQAVPVVVVAGPGRGIGRRPGGEGRRSQLLDGHQRARLPARLPCREVEG